ncbi:MAG TPA: phosphoglucosamine mutase [Actinomycetota bacterium]|jgi:phosphoglucosamine mutase
MPRLFGTDGVRGVANEDLTPDLALALGRAAGRVLAPGGEVVVGRDTRLSGPMLEGALVAGLCSAGTDVRLAGIVPTPAIAWLTLEEKAAGGAMISASHNPVPDNGIKFFSPEGFKIATVTEDQIETQMEEPGELPTGTDVGASAPIDDALERYVDHVVAAAGRLNGLRVVLDCAFGAAWEAGPEAFRRAGVNVVAINAEPDGARINVACGSTDMTQLAERVVAEGADLGIGFDGDADRALAVDERGGHVDGDRIIALCALRLQEQGRLHGNIVVGTVMSNLGFTRALAERDIHVVAAPVGDRFVVEEMTTRGAVLGGEQSGHVIFAEHSTTGDGILTGLMLAELVAAAGDPLSRLAHWYEPWPQVLINVRVRSRDALEGAEAVWDEVREVESSLGEGGRVLLRPSGTEPVVRVMVEAAEAATAQAAAERLAAAVEALAT